MHPKNSTQMEKNELDDFQELSLPIIGIHTSQLIRAPSEKARQRDMTKRIAPLLNPPPAKCAVKESENSPIAKISHLFI